jgi:ribose 5-phosphate isomerase RpiB
MRIAVASDHAAVDVKTELRDYLIGLGHEVADLGPVTADRVDYPDYGYKLAAVIADGTAEDRGSAFRSRDQSQFRLPLRADGRPLCGGAFARA